MTEPTLAMCEEDEDCKWFYSGKTAALASTAAAWHARSTGHLISLYTEGQQVGIVQP